MVEGPVGFTSVRSTSDGPWSASWRYTDSSLTPLAVSLIISSPSPSPSSLDGRVSSLYPSVFSSLGLLALAMVIAGADEPSPELAASWSAVVAKPPSEPEGATTAMKPPLPPAPKPTSAVSEMPPPLAPDAPVAVTALVQSVPVAAPSPPAAAPAPPADSVVPPVPAPAGAVADPPVPLHGAPAAPSVSAPADLAPASALPPKAASATTADPAPPVSPAQERRSSRRRRDSPRRYQQQAHWPAHPGGQGDWRVPRGRGSGGGYRPPVTMANLQREVSRAVREERAAQSQSSSMRASPAVDAPRLAALPLSPPPVAAPPPPIPVPPAPAPATSAPPSGSRLHLPPVLLVAGVEFVAAGGGSSAQYSHHDAADGPLLFLTKALQPPQTRIPEATLGQLHRLAESLHALLLIQVLAHSSLPVIPAETFRGRQRDTCLDAADQLASLLAPVLAAPAEGGAAAAGQLDEAVRGLRRHLRAGSGAAAIGASTLVVRELWRSLTGVLHALGAHRM
ncbi:unnamed protein product [Closterium sp. Naga37s-1]|nr:unnamed protein product [Closterium sp. Naga37s-1]